MSVRVASQSRRSKVRPYGVAWVAIGLVAVACRRDPVERVADIPLGSPPPPPAELSRFSAPLTYDFSGVLRVVDRAVPTTFGSLDSVHVMGSDTRRHYAFVATRGPFSARAEDSLVYLRATISYAARGFYKPPIGPTLSGGCGGDTAARPRVVIEIATPLTLDSTWHLRSKAVLVRVEPASAQQRDRCDVTFLHHDVTDRVIDAARSAVSLHLNDIDRRVAQVDLTDRFAPAWNTLGAPIRLSDGLWLVLDPRRLAIGRVTGHDHVLAIPVSLEARPLIVTAVDPPPTSHAVLPPLAHGGADDGFHIAMDGQIDYTAASAMVAGALKGRRVSQAGGAITITNAQVAPAPNGRLALTVWFDGDATGRLQFVGTPVLDTLAGSAARHEIVMRDLDYDLATSNPLLTTYAWLRSDAMRTTFRERAHIPVDSALSIGKTLLSDGLNRRMGPATLSARVTSVALRGLFVTRGSIVVRAEATGTARMSVK